MTSCGACSADAVVHWLRRPTADELALIVAAENERRAFILAAANPELPPPNLPDLPTASDTVQAVFSCAQHGISLDAAAHIHAANCSGPNSATLPLCDCTPEPFPTDSTGGADTGPELPAGWIS
jgi:hypothetical protein